VGFAEPGRSPGLLVSSYLTVSPLPRSRPGVSRAGSEAVYSLLHFPYRSHMTWLRRWALPTTAPCGVRTFLRGMPPGRPISPVDHSSDHTGTTQAPRRSSRPPRTLAPSYGALRQSTSELVSRRNPLLSKTTPARKGSKETERIEKERRETMAPLFDHARQSVNPPGKMLLLAATSLLLSAFPRQLTRKDFAPAQEAEPRTNGPASQDPAPPEVPTPRSFTVTPLTDSHLTAASSQEPQGPR